MDSKFKPVSAIFEDAKAFKLQGNQFYQSKNYKRAIKKYHCALIQIRAISSRDTVGRSMSFFGDCVDDGLKYTETVDFKEKVETLELECTKNLAMVFIAEEKWSQGHKYSRQALDLNEHDEKSTYRYALCSLRLGLIDECKFSVDRLLLLQPESKLYLQLQRDMAERAKKQSAVAKRMYQNMFQSSWISRIKIQILHLFL